MRFAIPSASMALAVLSFASVGQAVEGSWTVGFNDGGYCGDPVGAAFGDSVDQECTNIDSSNNYRWGETSGDGPYYGSEGGVGWSVVLFSTEGCADDSTYVTQLQISNQCSGTPIEIDVADQQYWKSYSAKWVDYS